MTHPGWIVEYLQRGGGTPMLGNWQPYAPAGAERRGGLQIRLARCVPFNAQTWRDLETLPQAVPAQPRRQRAS